MAGVDSDYVGLPNAGAKIAAENNIVVAGPISGFPHPHLKEANTTWGGRRRGARAAKEGAGNRPETSRIAKSNGHYIEHVRLGAIRRVHKFRLEGVADWDKPARKEAHTCRGIIRERDGALSKGTYSGEQTQNDQKTSFHKDPWIARILILSREKARGKAASKWAQAIARAMEF